jgi:hypothetical protein
MTGPATVAARTIAGRLSNRHILIAAFVLATSGLLVSCDFDPRSRPLSAGSCPRPQLAVGEAPRFNDQEREIRALRERAFRSDFFAQLELARRYEGERTADRNLEDPVEAATWYALALANPAGYQPLGPGGRPEHRYGERSRVLDRYDDCRAYERADAARTLDQLLARMDDSDWERVRNRITYVLSTQGAEGFLTLARLHDAAFGAFGEPTLGAGGPFLRRPDQAPPPPSAQLFPRNDVDVYLYDELAAQTGDVGAFVLMGDVDRATARTSSYASVVHMKVNRWVAPYEFYPPGSPRSGVPHSDESVSRGDVADAALARIDDLPFVHVLEALSFLGVIPKCDGHYVLRPNEVQTFEAMLGRRQTGHLSPLEKVRAIQYAATNGSDHAQLVLAVMYTEGVGVPADYARAYYWFNAAAKQGSPEAKFAISTYFSQGLAGVADQNKAEAVVQQVDAALSGFRPSADHLQAMLSRTTGPFEDDAFHSLSERERW